jgi:hypothetical protein
VHAYFSQECYLLHLGDAACTRESGSLLLLLLLLLLLPLLLLLLVCVCLCRTPVALAVGACTP